MEEKRALGWLLGGLEMEKGVECDGLWRLLGVWMASLGEAWRKMVEAWIMVVAGSLFVAWKDKIFNVSFK